MSYFYPDTPEEQKLNLQQRFLCVIYVALKSAPIFLFIYINIQIIILLWYAYAKIKISLLDNLYCIPVLKYIG
jgi:hypothetical protein